MNDKNLSTPRKFLSLALGAGAACLLTSCATNEVLEMPKETGYRLGSVSAQEHATARGWLSGSQKFYWDPQAPSSGSNKIIISLPEQKAFYYRDGRLVGATIVSTGREGHSTPTGSYHVLSKHEEHRSSLYGGFVDIASGRTIDDDVDTRKKSPPPGAKYVGAEMPYFLRLKHGRSGITSIGMHAGYLPGYPASHGCIRLPRPAAAKFFQETGTGTPVYIENAKPDTSQPPATAPMLMASTMGPGPGQPAYAPNSKKARAVAKAKKQNIKQTNDSTNVEVQQSQATSGGTSISSNGTRYLQN